MEQTSTLTRINAGLRAYLLGVYNYMTGGLLVSALCAYLGSTPLFIRMLYQMTPQGVITYSLLGWMVLIAPFILVFMFGSAVQKLNVQRAQTIFWLFAVLMGFGMSSIFFVYSGASLIQVFLVTSASFAGLSLYGYTTKNDLTGVGAFAMMGLWGLVFTVIINWFLKSPAVAYAVSIIGVGIFVALTAYDTQRVKNLYSSSDSAEMQKSKAISGALTLYLDFINLFLMLLRLMGNRK